MNGNRSQIRPDSILEGDVQEPYTPVVGPIRSPIMNKVLERVKFMLSADANLTWKDMANVTKTVALKGGIVYPFYAREIHAVSAGTVIIIHDGVAYDPRFE